MSIPSPDDTPPTYELQGLDPKDLLKAGLETVPPVTLPPQRVDSDATIPVSRPQPTQPAPQVELPLPEELTQLLPVGAYHVESFLGQGGMGAVYKGMQVRLKRPVAIKIMRRDLGKDHDFEARFEREAQAMAKLNHPNIVSVIDFGEAGPDYLYIVMELIDGADLMDVIRGGQMTQEMALSLLPQICDALQFAHDHGIVHRDIKPSNIMLTRDARVKMCDFGLAKRYDVESSFRTQTGTGMGTPDYAAPEQFDPKANIDHRADIYALGVMIYQMITGQLPRGVWKPPSQRAKVSTQWDAVVSRAMQSDPSDRYQHASDIKTDVSSIPLAESRRSRQSAEAASPLAPQSRALASAPTKSRAPLLFGILGLAAVIALGAFFALKKPEESSRVRQDVVVAPPSPASSGASTTSTTTVSIPGLPDLPPLAIPPGEPGFVKEWQVAGTFLRDAHVLPDNRRLLVFQDNKITLFDMEKEESVWTTATGISKSAACNRDGSRFADCCFEKVDGKGVDGPDLAHHGKITLRITATGETIQSWSFPAVRMAVAINRMSISDDGKTIVAGVGGVGAGKGDSLFLAFQEGKQEPVAQWRDGQHNGHVTICLGGNRFLSTGNYQPMLLDLSAPAKTDSPFEGNLELRSDISPDRKWLVAAEGTFSFLWDVSTRKRIRALKDSPPNLAWTSFAGNDLVVGQSPFSRTEKMTQRYIGVWDRNDGRLLARLTPTKPGEYFEMIKCASNGSFCLTQVKYRTPPPGGAPTLIQIWRLPKPGQVQTESSQPAPAAHGTPASSPNVSIPGLPDLPPLTIPSHEPGLVKEFLVSGNYLRNSHVLPDSRRMLSFPDGTAVLIDLETTRPIWSQPTERGFFAKAINRDGSRFATYHLFNEKGVGLGTQTGATEARICLHETATGKLLQIWKTLTDGKDANYDFIGLTPSGTRIIARVRGGEAAFSTFLLFEEGKPDPVERWEAPPGHYGYNTYAWKEDAFISTSPTGALLMLPGGKMEPLVTELPQYHSDLSPAGNWLVATNNSKLGLWDLAARKFTHNLEHSTTSGRVISFAGEDLVLMAEKPSVAGLFRTLQCWDRKTGILIAKLPVTRTDEYFDNVIGAPNGTFAVLRLKHDPAPAGGEKNLLQIWRLPKPGELHSSGR